MSHNAHEVCDKSSLSTSNIPTHSQSELAFDAVHFSLVNASPDLVFSVRSCA
ncbi:hypothetical protein BDR03DRAFT_969215 [Suillus americanus]|nr:hypothetical protein BDR03DRAFT_969215 [Suillus americanus]